jgi:hypothetical protein
MIWFRARLLLPLCSLSAAGASVVHEAMLKHIVSCGGWVGPVAVLPSKMGLGFGCFTTQDVEEDEMLFIVPARLQISGPTARQFSTAPTSTAAIAGFMALSLLSDCPTHAPYLRTLPLTPDDSLVWWSDRELAFLKGTSAHAEATHIRSEADAAASSLLLNMPLRESYGLHDGESDIRLAEMCRAAYSCVLSRAFGTASEESGREMVPLLDMLQHGGSACSVTYSDEVVDERFESASEEECDAILATPNHPDLCCEVRSTRSLPAGTELTTDYGSHPDFVFGTHYTFTTVGAEAHEALAGPSDGAASSWAALTALGACATQLKLDGFAAAMEEDDAITAARPSEWGRALALEAQRAAQHVDTATAKSARSAAQTRRRRYPGREAAQAPFDELVNLIASMSPETGLVTSFVVTCAQIDATIPLARAGSRPPEGCENLDALLCCARLCVLDEDDLRQMDAEHFGHAEPIAEGARQALKALVLARLVSSRSGKLSEANDQRAAALLVASATRQLVELDFSTPDDGEAETAAGLCLARLDLARSLRRSERFALVRLRDMVESILPQAS